MKIIRYFIQHMDEETGLNGFLPLWIPKAAGFDPSTLSGMVHDMLEHRLCDKGHFHEELMAIGRMVALRVIPGVGRNSYISQEESLGVEMAGAFARMAGSRHEIPTLAEPPGTGTVPQAERQLDQIVRHCRRRLPDFLHEEFDAESGLSVGEAWLRNFAEVMRSWLRIGYLDALRRYGTQDHGCYDVGYSAFGWAERNRRRIEVLSEDCLPGSVLRLQFDTAELVMTDRLIEPDPEYGHMPDWLRNRICVWRNARITH